MYKRAIILHGGVGDISKLNQKELDGLSRAIVSAAERGLHSIKAKNALEGVQDAVVALESSALFNAGIGSALTLSGNMEMDAAIMDGRTLSSGAVGAVRNVRNPIVMARIILEETDHSLIVGNMAEKFAEKFGLRVEITPTAERKQKWQMIMKNPPKYLQKNLSLASDTVGAVAIDGEGNLASAVSTGGLWLKIDGRVGDSSIVGTGLYAENGAGAVASTGIGEAIMNACLSKVAVDYMGQGRDAMQACKAAIEHITKKKGSDTAGLIAIDSKGNFGYALNTKTMIIARYAEDMDKPAVKILRSDL